LTLDPRHADAFYIWVQAAGMPHVPNEFAILPQHQIIGERSALKCGDIERIADRVLAEFRAAPRLIK
jgi:hypothetical protein